MGSHPYYDMARITTGAKATTRARLLETAAAHFARHGLNDASIDAISLEAGFAKGTIYNYFPGKEALFHEVVVEGCRRAVERYRTAAQGGSVRERLAALAAADVAVLRESEPFQKVVIREALSFQPATYPRIVEGLAPFVQQIESILAEAVASGDVRDDRPVAEMSLLFVGLLALFYVQHWGSNGAWPTLDDIPELAVTTFLDGAATRKTPETRRRRR